MSGSRLKTIAIAALLVINIVFLTVIIMDAVADVRYEREALENVCAVLRAGGIGISPENVRASGDIRTMRTARSLEAEEVIARAVLGDTTMSEQGVIYLYENAERGTATFRTGDFEINLNDGAILNTSDALKTVQGLLRSMKIDTSEPSVSIGPFGETVVAVGAFRNASIFNCIIEFEFRGGSLMTIRGRYAAGFEPAEDGIAISSAGTALLGFLAEVVREDRPDVQCTQVLSVEAGYRHRVIGSFGEGVIAPAWLIITDNGQYLIDDETGEIWPFN